MAANKTNKASVERVVTKLDVVQEIERWLEQQKLDAQRTIRNATGVIQCYSDWSALAKLGAAMVAEQEIKNIERVRNDNPDAPVVQALRIAKDCWTYELMNNALRLTSSDPYANALTETKRALISEWVQRVDLMLRRFESAVAIAAL